MKAFAAALVALVLASATSASAAGQPKPAATANDAKTEFAAGRSRFAAKDYAGALPLFRKAFDASASPNASLYVGLCLIELNQPVEAYEVLSATARESEKRMASDPAYQHTNEVAKEKLGKLEKKVGRVTVTLVDAPSGATVTVNAAPLAADRLGAAMAIAPGRVTVVASAAGQPDQRAEVTVAAGEEKPVVLHFAPPSAGSPLGPAPVVEVGPSRPGMSTLRLVGIGAAGVGVIGFVVAAASRAASSAKYDDVKAHCTPGPCTDPKYVDEISSGKTLDALATTGLVIGIVGVAGGATLFFVGGKKSETSASLEVGPRAISVSGAF